MKTTLCILISTILFSISGLHFYWLLGGEWALKGVIPTRHNSDPLFKPGIGATLIVAMGLLAFSYYYLIQAGILPFKFFSNADYVGYAISTIFLFRAIGDFRYIGFFKKEKTTLFARRDSRLYSPLCLFLALSGILIEIV